MSDFSSILQFLGRLRVQQGSYEQTALLEDGSRLRFDAVFNPGDALATLDHSRLGALKILPDRLTLTKVDGSFVEEAMDTRGCLGRLRAGLGPGVGRVAAALEELSPRIGELAHVVRTLSRIKNDFTLLVLPGVAWFDAVLPAGELPGLVYPEFSGHLMIKNLALDIGGSNKHIGFELSILAAESAGTLVIESEAIRVEVDHPQFSIDMTIVVGLTLEGGVGVSRIDTNIARADIVAAASRTRFGSKPSDPVLSGIGGRITVNGLSTGKIELQDGSPSKVHTRGQISVWLPEASLRPGPVGIANPDIRLTIQDAKLFDLAACVEVGELAQPSANSRTALTIGRVELKANVSMRDAVDVNGLDAVLVDLALTQGQAGLDLRADVKGSAVSLTLYGSQDAAMSVMEVNISAERFWAVSPSTDTARAFVDIGRLSLGTGQGRVILPGMLLDRIAGDLTFTAVRSMRNGLTASMLVDGLRVGTFQMNGTTGGAAAALLSGTDAMMFGAISVQDRGLRRFSRGEFSASLASLSVVLPLDTGAADGKLTPVVFHVPPPANGSSSVNLRVANLFSFNSASGQVVEGDFELDAQLARARIASYPLAKSFVLTNESFNALAAPGPPPPLPAAVLVLLQRAMLDQPFASLESLDRGVREVLDDDAVWKLHRARIGEVAAVKRTILKQAELTIQGMRLDGQLATPPQRDTLLEGQLHADTVILAFSALEDLFLADSIKLVNAHPVAGRDALQVVDFTLALPANDLVKGSLGILLAFDSAEAIAPGMKFEVLKHPNNKVRFVGDFRGKSGQSLTGQISMPNARMTIDNIPPVDVTNIALSVNEDRPVPGLADPFRALILERVVRLGFTAKIPEINFGGAGTHRLSFFGGLFSKLRAFLFLVGIDLPESAFGRVVDALSNPLGWLKEVADWITQLTGFGIGDVGVYVERGQITGKIDPVFSSHRALAFRVSIPLPRLGVYIGYKYRVPALKLPPWEDKSDEEIIKGIVDLSGMKIDLVVKLSFKIDPVTRSIEIDGFDFYALPDIGDPLAESLIGALESGLLEFFFSIGQVKAAILTAIRDQFRIPLPDNIRPDLLRLEFNAQNETMTLNLETFEREWNQLT